jgi:hypothetical protein
MLPNNAANINYSQVSNNVDYSTNQTKIANRSQWDNHLVIERDAILSEFLNSGISQEVFDLNVRLISDIEFDPITKEVTATPIDDILGYRYTRFGHIAKDNLTAALFTQETGEAWQLKIFGETTEDGRTGKYMAPKGIGDKPYLPTIPITIARKSVAKVSPLLESSLLEWLANGGLFWEWLKEHKEIPLIVTEGGKKALSAISQGNIALSLFGCNCGVTDLTVKPELLPYVEGRRVLIAFDRDEKPETRHKVFKASKRLGSAIAYHAKGSPFVMTWEGKQGKGLDDLIANDPQLFHTAITTAKSLDEWKLACITDLTDLISETVDQKYLDVTIPTDAQLICTKSPTGTGKTEWLVWVVSELIKKGDRVLVLSHREQLVKELARRFALPYRTEIRLSGEGFELGYCLCIDSLHPKANPGFNPDDWEGCSVVVDECEQVFWHLLNSSTCQRNRPSILNSFKQLLNNAIEYGGKIYLADADLSKISINYVQSLLETKIKAWVIVNKYKAIARRIANIYSTPEGLMSDLIESVKNSDRVIVHTGAQKVTSKWGTINIESALKKVFPDKKILRVDAKTVNDPSDLAYRCTENLNDVLARYDVVIVSPTLETGVSIDIDHFNRVFCFAVGSQTVEAVCQSLARVRSDVPRHIWVTKRSSESIGNGSHDPYSLKNSQNKQFKTNLSLLAIADLVEDANPKNLETWANYSALHNYGFKNYRSSVYEKLKNEGYTLIEAEIPDDSVKISDFMGDLMEQNHNEQCQKISEADNLDDLALKKLQKQRTKTEAERNQEKKGELTRRYLTDEVTPELVKADEKGLYGQLQLHYYLTVGNEFLKQRDTEKAEKLSNKGKIFTPDLNRSTHSIKVNAMQAINVEQFFDCDRVFTSENLRAWFDNLMSYRHDIKTYLNQSINPEKDSPIGFAQRFLGNMNLKLTCIGQRRENGRRIREYQMIDLNPDDRAAIFARWYERDSMKCHTPLISISEQRMCA